MNQAPAAMGGDQRESVAPNAGRLRKHRCIHIGTAIVAPTKPAREAAAATAGTTKPASWIKVPTKNARNPPPSNLELRKRIA
jgi:hypothetical protein